MNQNPDLSIDRPEKTLKLSHMIESHAPCSIFPSNASISCDISQYQPPSLDFEAQFPMKRKRLSWTLKDKRTILTGFLLCPDHPFFKREKKKLLFKIMKRQKTLLQISAHMQKQVLKLQKLYNLVQTSRQQLSERGYIVPQLYVGLLHGLIAEKSKFSAIILETYKHSKFKRIWTRFNSLIDNMTRHGFNVQVKEAKQIESRQAFAVDLEGMQHDLYQIMKKYYDKERSKSTMNFGLEAIIRYQERKSLEDNRIGVNLPQKVMFKFTKGYESLKYLGLLKVNKVKKHKTQAERILESQTQLERKIGEKTKKTIRQELKKYFEKRKKKKIDLAQDRLSEDNTILNERFQSKKTSGELMSDKTVKRDSFQIPQIKHSKKKSVKSLKQPIGSCPVPPPSLDPQCQAEFDPKPTNSVIFLSPKNCSEKESRKGSLFSHVRNRKAYCNEEKDQLQIVVRTDNFLNERCNSPQI